MFFKGKLLVPVTVLTYRRFALPSILTMYGVCVMVSWYFGFLGIILLPLDLARRLKWVKQEPSWRTAATLALCLLVTFVFAWLLDPILQAYDAGQYTWQDAGQCEQTFMSSLLSPLSYRGVEGAEYRDEALEVVEFLIGMQRLYRLYHFDAGV